MSGLSKLYGKLPVWIQNLGISAYGLYWKHRRFGGTFKKQCKDCTQRETFSHQEWRSYQTTELQKMLKHAFEHVPFYSNSLTAAGYSLDKLSSLKLNEIAKLPYLEKHDLRKYGKTTLLADNLDKNGSFYSSSGSSGTPTQIYYSKTMHRAWSAIFEARIRFWAGITRFSSRGTIGGRRVVEEGPSSGPFYRFNLVEKQAYFSAYHIAPQNIPDYIEGIKKHELSYMTGYAMSNFILARFIEDAGLKAPRLKAVITSSEKLTTEMRDTFKRVYECKTYDSYSGVEACGLISECEHGRLHVSPDAGIIEIIKDNGKSAQPGESGEAICTGILNFDQPLIRYRIGDFVRLAKDQTCPCARNMPIIDEIIGRTEDIVTGPDGRQMVRFHNIFTNLDSIIEGQIIQETASDFEVKVVTSGELTEAVSAELTNRMKSQLGDVSIKIVPVELIPRNINGKFKAVISHLNKKN